MATLTKIVVASAFAGAALAVALHTTLIQTGKHALDPAPAIQDRAAADQLHLREQVDHPVSDEVSADAIELRGKAAPDFRLRTASGSEASLSDYRDKPLLIFFVEKQCPCCLGAKVYVERLNALYGDVARTVAILNGTESEAKTWKSATGATFEVLADPDQKAIQAYGAKRGVYTALVTPDGKIDRMFPGYSQPMLEETGTRIAELASIAPRRLEGRKAPPTLISGCLFPDPNEEKTTQ